MALRNFIRLEETDSTNGYALRNIHELKDRQVIVAEKQFSGRGRLGRKWVSDVKDNVYMSIVLKPCTVFNKEVPLKNITQYASVVLCRVLENYGIDPEIKWPNDVLVNEKKIAGILSEVSSHGESLKGFVLGIGVNLNLTSAQLAAIDQPATALNILIDRPVDKNSFIELFEEEFFKRYDAFLERGFMFIKAEYVKKSSFLGRDIQINLINSTNRGIAKSINDDGSLQMIKDNMEENTVTVGDLVCY
jgi:BirA family biotin operon repressor/biotin-[acetyl-CoA-carboxylase] ligase